MFAESSFCTDCLDLELNINSKALTFQPSRAVRARKIQGECLGVQVKDAEFTLRIPQDRS